MAGTVVSAIVCGAAVGEKKLRELGMQACISGSFYVLHIDIYRTAIYTKNKKKANFFYTQLSKADI